MGTLRLAILCSGQAGQQRAMLENLLNAPDLAGLRRIASELLGEELEVWWRNLTDEAIFANEIAQFSIALYQLSVWQRIAPLIPQPALIAGYSLGELVAYHVAGSLDAVETLVLVRHRARLMDEAAGGMAVSGGCMLLWRGRVSRRTQEAKERGMLACGLDTAIVRNRGEQVLAGSADAVGRFLADPQIINPDMVRLAITTPSHSRYLVTASEAFRGALDNSRLADPAVPVLAGVDATRVRTRSQAVDVLSRQISTTLRWDRCMTALEEAGINTVIELGPGNDLAKLVEAGHPRISARSIDEFHDWYAVREWLKSRSN
ncbi:MAG: acyltransferase domain-containing protein [Desulfuromonadaceae bacterium]|nr:acyltransferase domain-containing protein [Desulfuromonadaceae bacterium]